jgi:hypothetical protein
MSTSAQDLMNFVRVYLPIDCGDMDKNLVMIHTLTLLLEGKLEEADQVAESLCEPYRSEIKCEILRLSHDTSLVASGLYYVKAFIFAYWLIKELSEPYQFGIRDAILYEVWNGTPPMAYRWAEMLIDPVLVKDVENGIMSLTDTYRSSR